MAPTEGDGGFQLGFQVQPLTSSGDLDTSLDNKGIQHSVEHDMLYKMALENREGGNKMVQEGQYEQAIGRYSEAIMQLRSCESETDIKWDDAARLKVRELRAAAYLNLSLCFTKKEQWTHAVNTATRALQGDKQVPDPKDDVLPPEKKAKALYRRATAHCEGFGSFDKARDDLRRALEYAPEDKAVKQMLAKCEVAVKKTSKAADKKMAGFLKKEANSGEGLFDDSLRPPDNPPPKEGPKEPMKLSEGLWVMPKKEEEEEEQGDGTEHIDLEALKQEITEIKQDQPELYNELREKVKALAEQKVGDAEAEAVGDAAAASGAGAPAEAPSTG